MSKPLAFIPTKDSSVRVPGKNLLKLGDIPVFYHSVLYARRHGCVPVVVTNHDSKIADWLMGHDEDCLVYQTEIKEHHDEYREAIQTLNLNVTPDDKWVVLQPTSPIRKEGLVYDLLEAGNAFTAQKIKVVGNYNNVFRIQRDSERATDWFYHWDGNILSGYIRDLDNDYS